MPCVVGTRLRSPICRFTHEPNYLGEHGVNLIAPGVAQANAHVVGHNQEIQALMGTINGVRAQAQQWRQKYQRKSGQLAIAIQNHMSALRFRDEIIGLKK
jgi:hypothetical protein